jgi:hypothetical protein
MAALKSETEPGETREELLAALNAALARAVASIRSVDPAVLKERRGVGRQNLPSTVIGLLVHIAEHTQRHVGQAITTAKIVRSMRESRG